MKELSDQEKNRLEKLKQLKKLGHDPFPARVKRTHQIKQLVDEFIKFEKKSMEVALVGRIMTLRVHGGSAFAHLADGTGKFQLYFDGEMLC